MRLTDDDEVTDINLPSDYESLKLLIDEPEGTYWVRTSLTMFKAIMSPALLMEGIEAAIDDMEPEG